MPSIDPAIFRAYDIRGIYPDQINEDIVYRIAQAYSWYVGPETVVVGHDVRISGPSLAQAAIKGFEDAGVNVIDIGQISTDMMYFTVANYGYDGGIAISASHNPKEYNGVKMVRRDAVPIAGDSGIPQMRDWVLAGNKLSGKTFGRTQKKDILDDYCRKVLSFLTIPLTKHYKVVANANFGMSGLALRRLIELGNLPIDLVELNFTPDGSFPKGRPDPMIPELRIETENKVKEVGADFGVAWDGDADRCFFYTQTGESIEGYFTTAVLATYFLQKYPGSNIYCDPRLIWAVQKRVAELGGKLFITPAGHSFIKEEMRKENIIFGGEATGHYYFRDFFFCDNGMIPFIIMLQLLEGVDHISDLYTQLLAVYHISGELDFEVHDAQAVITAVKNKYINSGEFSDIDGISFSYPQWRFNLRASNTEPLVRLNVEGYDQELVSTKTQELTTLIHSLI
jgi:phosphomannomutase